MQFKLILSLNCDFDLHSSANNENVAAISAVQMYHESLFDSFGQENIWAFLHSSRGNMQPHRCQRVKRTAVILSLKTTAGLT